ncbi:hypothetical protein EFY87_13295 [Flexivirga caeni]|uniref:Esterase n=1 Tax=Flexivirga caeni TaxID=2294115 RepID=A0A3M9M5M6_9MICO|nr:hypothetical protein EFY87_13295 [Flexivirga caeni]
MPLLDPACSRTVSTDFGDRSEWRAPDYTPPRWLDAPAVPGRLNRIEVPSALTHPLPAQVWAPRGLRARDAAPLLVVFDGSSYAGPGQLLQWAGAAIESGMPPLRLLLVDAVQRMQWFSGSERFLRTVDFAIEDVNRRYAVRGPVGLLGASLGGLTALLVSARRDDVGVVVSQSGSFFTELSDEGDWPWLSRVRRLVASLRAGEPVWGRRRASFDDLRVGLTCGRGEDNFGNNRDMATALRRRGAQVTFAPGRDLHNVIAWRDQWDPLLADLLTQVWRG